VLPLVCVDGIESLDSETFALFREEAEKSDCQFIVARVSNEDFAIETKGAA